MPKLPRLLLALALLWAAPALADSKCPANQFMNAQGYPPSACSGIPASALPYTVGVEFSTSGAVLHLVSVPTGIAHGTPSSINLTNALALPAAALPAFTGDATAPGGSAVLTLPPVNSNVGTFQGITVNAKGQVTAASNQSYLTANQSITLSGDCTGTGTTAITTTCTKFFSGQTLQASTSNPTGTTSLTGVMMGLGTTCKLTPTYSTRVVATITATISNTVAADGALAVFKYGTGTAPSNGAAPTGTSLGAVLGPTVVNTNGAAYPISLPVVITGLTPGTPYWFDVTLQAFTGGTAGFANVNCNAFEM